MVIRGGGGKVSRGGGGSMRGVNAGTVRGGRNVISGRTKSQTGARYGEALRSDLSPQEAESSALSTGSGGDTP